MHTGGRFGAVFPKEKRPLVAEVLEIDNCPIVICTRSMAEEYQNEVLVEAIPYVLRQVPNTIFLLAWHFCNNPVLERIIQRLTFRERNLQVVKEPGDYNANMEKMEALYLSLLKKDKRE